MMAAGTFKKVATRCSSLVRVKPEWHRKSGSNCSNDTDCQRSGYFASPGVMTRPSWKTNSSGRVFCSKLRTRNVGRDRTQLPGDRSHHLPKEIIQFGYRGKRIEASPKGLVCFCQLGGALLRKQFPFACHGRSHFFRALQIGDVHGCPNKLENTRFVNDRVAHSLDIFYRSIGQNEPVFLYKITSFANRPINCLLRARSILRVDSLEKHPIGRHRLLRVETKDPKMFLRPVGFSRGHIPSPAGSMAYFLPFGQVGLATSKLRIQSIEVSI